MPDYNGYRPKRSPCAGLLLILLLFILTAASSLWFFHLAKPADSSVNALTGAWPRFRGEGGLGVVKNNDFPINWNCSSSNPLNVKWKCRIPYPGYSSPVVLRDRVYITGIDIEKDMGLVICYAAQTGDLIWRAKADVERDPGYTPCESFYNPAVAAASTMAVDTKRSYAIFANSDLAAFDQSGAIVWSKNLGSPNNTYGYSTSLVVYNNLLFIQFDQPQADDDSFTSKLYALDSSTGDEVWTSQRPVSDSWTTPIVAVTENGPQLITVASPWIIAYDPATGKEIWKVTMGGPDFTPSPVYAKGLVLAIAPNYEMYAIKTDGAGDVSETHIAWTYDLEIPDICSPAIKDDLVFLLLSGIFTCLDLNTGEMLWDCEFDNDFESSPTVVGDKVYLVSKKGDVFILAADREYNELSRAGRL